MSRGTVIEASRFVIAAVVCAVALTAGCSAPLGSDDVELTYRLSADPRHDAAAAARGRLLSAHVPADVTADSPDTLVVRVDAAHEISARRALEWWGGIDLHAVDPDHVITRAEAHGLTRVGDHYTGARADVYTAVLSVRDDTDRLVASARDGLQAEVVRQGSLAVLPRSLPFADGTDVVIPVSPAQLDDLTAVADSGVVVAASTVIARGPASAWLRTEGEAAPAIVVRCGDDLRGYARARQLADLLSSGLLTSLTLLVRTEPPTDWTLAIASIAIPLATGLLWLLLLRRFDPTRPEPLWLVLATFALGIAAQRLAAAIELHAWTASPYLDPRALARDHAASAFPLSLLACALVVGAVEEGAKLLATVPALRHREFDEPVDGIVYAGAAAIGFAVAENISYFTIFRLDDATTVSRTLTTIPGHALLASIWGYALGQRLVGRKRRLALAFGIAVLAHACYDTSLEFEIPYAGEAINIALAIGFAVLVRRALRWGQVAGPGTPVAGNRVLVPVGMTAGAVVGFATMIAASYLLQLHAAAARHAGERVTVELLVRGAVLAVVFGAGAVALVRMLPLDVAIDDAGVTYAGGLIRWADIRGAHRRRTAVVLYTTAGAVRIGPAAPAAVDQLSAKIAERTTPSRGARMDEST
jgi:RsiW-degrading membrane proteinase PrsW (M82 family)